MRTTSSTLALLGLVIASGTLHAQAFQLVTYPGLVCPRPEPPPDSIPELDPHAPAYDVPALISPNPKDFLKGLKGAKGVETRLGFIVDVDGRVDLCTVEIQSQNDTAWTSKVLERLQLLRFRPGLVQGKYARVKVNQAYGLQ